MRAVIFNEYGGPEVLQVGDVPEPHPGPGQVRIAVRAAGVNPIDWKMRSGAMREMMPLDFPALDGREASGVVDEVGDGASGVAAGDEVFGFAVGGAAGEYAVLDDFARKPSGLSFEEAAGLPVAVETSVRVFTVLGGLSEGQTIVINGAAGGVGAVAVQLAVARGARVIGTASERNHDFLRSLGAEPTTYGEGLVERVRALAPDGIDLAFDTAGKGANPHLIELARAAAPCPAGRPRPPPPRGTVGRGGGRRGARRVPGGRRSRRAGPGRRAGARAAGGRLPPPVGPPAPSRRATARTHRTAARWSP